MCYVRGTDTASTELPRLEFGIPLRRNSGGRELPRAPFDENQKMGKKKAKAGNELITVTGIVIPVEWDEHGNALATTVSTPGEREYLVEQDSTGKELLGLVRQEIEVSGVLGKGMEGGNTIRVSSYRLKGVRDWQGEAEPEKTTDAPCL